MDKPSKVIFLESEGDSWYSRNHSATSKISMDDKIITAIAKLPSLRPGSTILEIGCGGGERLALLQQYFGFKCNGIDPGAKSVRNAVQLGVDALQGTADSLPFDDNKFEVVIFGFCLYLCDRNDLFKISSEADRVLKSPGWLIIKDFHSDQHIIKEYHHRSGIMTYKMDYRTLFTWHPFYTCYNYELGHHENGRYTDDIDEWVSVSVLRKKSTDNRS